ncbi:uncharacterized protein TNCV_3078721 [Trichonephila clavipes]|nr:uncharacterized protein TNCV_3078721 [Trichonephila clavipes]
MESVGAYRLFERSRETSKLEYVEFYADGDSKSHLAVKDIYGIDSPFIIVVPVKAIPCMVSVHWAPRADVPTSEHNLLAVFYNKNAGLPNSIINKIKPIYLQLYDQNLLRKCLHGKTQNANEAFNGCLWNVVPKEMFVELQTFSLGSYIAVINFNKGFTGLLSVLEALDIKIGSYILRGYAAIDQTRIEDSKRQTLFAQWKSYKKKIRAIKKRKVVNTEKHEGVTYKSRAF